MRGTDIEVYAKLPKSFSIPTPVGGYTPDWAIAFKQGSVKHVYFVAETKGSMSSMEMRDIKRSKIKCARKFFAKITSDQLKYEVIHSCSKACGKLGLMQYWLTYTRKYPERCVKAH
jgi:type III restriction enzyme